MFVPGVWTVGYQDKSCAVGMNEIDGISVSPFCS